MYLKALINVTDCAVSLHQLTPFGSRTLFNHAIRMREIPVQYHMRLVVRVEPIIIETIHEGIQGMRIYIE